MKTTHLEVLVEEQSMEEFLRRVLPKLVPHLTFEVYAHLSKEDLLKNLPRRLKAYSKWLPESACILVIVDRDDDDCRKLKTTLEKVAKDSGLSTRTTAGRGRIRVINRIAIEELESWYFGDWSAVLAAYPKVGATVASKAAYRQPDGIKGGTWEAFERELQKAGYFVGGLRKIEAARTIGDHLDPARCKSPSFRALRDALVAL